MSNASAKGKSLRSAREMAEGVGEYPAIVKWLVISQRETRYVFQRYLAGVTRGKRKAPLRMAKLAKQVLQLIG